MYFILLFLLFFKYFYFFLIKFHTFIYYFLVLALAILFPIRKIGFFFFAPLLLIFWASYALTVSVFLAD